jgi:hypothetical protein
MAKDDPYLAAYHQVTAAEGSMSSADSMVSPGRAPTGTRFLTSP